MQNLAGVPTADEQIEMELDGARIPIEQALVHRSEVPYTIVGRLGEFTFTRAWYYWVVEGMLPVSIAWQLYSDPLGRRDVRVNGFAGNIEPAGNQVRWLMPDGRPVHPADQEDQYRDLASRHALDPKPDDILWSDDPAILGAQCFVTSYHIDSYRGLKLFANTLREHGLVPVNV